MTDKAHISARNLATLGLASAAPIALFTGIGIGVTMIAGPPLFLVLAFVAALILSAVSLLVLAADNARGPSKDPHE